MLIIFAGEEKINMKILMATEDYDDRIVAFLEFKKLNAAHDVDFVTS